MLGEGEKMRFARRCQASSRAEEGQIRIHRELSLSHT